MQQQYHIDKHWRVGRIVTFQHCTEQYKCEMSGGSDEDDEWGCDCVHSPLMAEVLEVNGSWATVRLLDVYVTHRITERLIEGEHHQIICVPMMHAVASMCATQYRHADEREQFRLLLASKLEHLIFRTVATINTHNDPPVELYRLVHDGTSMGYTRAELVPRWAHASVDVRQPVIAKYGHYDGRTGKQPLRDNDPYGGTSIYYASHSRHGGRYGELDLRGDCKFGGGRNMTDLKDPLVAPHRDQILCGKVAVNDKGLYYKRWFLCSPQFLYLVTMLRRGYSIESREMILKRTDCSCYGSAGGNAGIYEQNAISGDNLYWHIAAYVMGTVEEPTLQVKRLIRLVNPVASICNNIK